MLLRSLFLSLALLLPPLAACAQPARPADRVGDSFEIHLQTVSETLTDDGSSSSSRSGSALVERVTALRDNGVELEFDLPANATEEDRARAWQFPARVFRSSEGVLQLLNAAELEARVQSWLQLGGLRPEACGKWVFTWAAHKIECDPQSVLLMIASFDLRLNDLRDGAPYREAKASEPSLLRVESSGPKGAVLATRAEVDPASVRQEYAEAAAIAKAMIGDPASPIAAALEAKAASRADEQISGTIETTFKTDATGHVTERTRLIQIEITGGSQGAEKRTTTETTTRRRASQ